MAKDSDSDQDKDQDNLFRKFMQSDKKFRLLKDNNKYTPESNNPEQPGAVRAMDPNLRRDTGPGPTEAPEIIPLSDNLWRPIVTAQEYISYFQPGLQAKTIKNLKTGKIQIQASLDLHTKTKDEAAKLFSNFIISCYKQQLRCICIIHGKGYRGDQSSPILKNLVNHWLYEFSEIIIGFCSCPPNLGGTGAILVLFKRNN